MTSSPLPYAALLPLEGVVRDYSWGSPTAIPQLLGRPPTGAPAAELWLGAHPRGPATIVGTRRDLASVIAARPEQLLGPDILARFGAELPFLMKVIAPAKALSIQVHPTREQAEAGFAAEEARGIPRDDPRRNYPDPHHKPEMVCALTPFEAFCGFRPTPDTLRFLEALAVPELAPFEAVLSAADGLRRAFALLLGPGSGSRPRDRRWPHPRLRAALGGRRRMVRQCRRDRRRGLRVSERHRRGSRGPAQLRPLGPAGRWSSCRRARCTATWAASPSRSWPVATTCCGAASRPSTSTCPSCSRSQISTRCRSPVRGPQVIDEESWYDPSIPEFQLSIHEFSDLIRIPPAGPQVLLCTQGEAYVTVGREHRSLPKGAAAFVAAGHALQLVGRATVFRATTGS